MATMSYYSTPPTDDLEGSLLTGDEAIILDALKNAKKASRRQYLNEILRILSNTHSPRVRNAAAIAVADLHAQKIKEVIKDVLIKLLVREDTKKSQGTLLYVLDEIGASIPIEVLTRVIATSRYEAREEAMGFLKSGRIDWNSGQLESATNKLRRLTYSKNSERSQAAKRALEFINRLVKSARRRSDRKTSPKPTSPKPASPKPASPKPASPKTNSPKSKTRKVA